MMKRLLEPVKNLMPSWGSSTHSVDDHSTPPGGYLESEPDRSQEHPKTELAGDPPVPGPEIPVAPVAKPKDGGSSQKPNIRGGESQEGRPPVNSQWSEDRDREQRKRKREQMKDLAKDVEAYRAQLRSAQNDLAEANMRTEIEKKSVKALQKEREEIRTRSQTAIDEHVKMAQMAETRAMEFEQKNRKLEDENRLLQQKLRASEDKHGRVAKLLEERNADFKGVQTFLTTADLYSGAEIIKMVESLNAEIFQIAAFIAELLEEDSMIATQQEHSANLQKYGRALDFAHRHYLGSVLFAHLANKTIEIRADPLPLQLAMQGIISAWCTYKTRSFWSNPLGESVHKIYRGIKASEIQAVAGRWRAITSAQLGPPVNQADMTFLVEMILALLCLCGWSASSQEGKKSISTIQNMLRELERLQIQTKTAIMEGITTADMEVYVYRPGELFGEHMEDTYGENVSDPGGGKERRVLCTVGMGLRKSVTKRSQDGQLIEQADVLLKGKVALASVLLEADNDSPKDGIRPQQQDGK